MQRYLSILTVIACVLGAEAPNYLPRLKMSTHQFNPEPTHLIGVMVEFQDEANDPDSVLTTGKGLFLTGSDTGYQSRCAGGFFVDPPPHNAAYFSNQLTAVTNYYQTVSNGALAFTSDMLPTVYQLNGHMAEYAQSDTALGRMFVESVELAREAIEPIFTEHTLIVVFHAGIGQDFTLPFLDPTPMDLSSAYIDPDMLAGQPPLFVNGYEVSRGVLLPETQNHIYYDVIEEIFSNITDYCDLQIGMTGTFAFLMGYAFGLPPLFVTEDGAPGINQGDPGVGVFGLMDQGSNNGRGVIPALPTAWTRLLKNWSTTETITSDFEIDVSTEQIYRIDITDSEYFLIENRNNFIDADMDIDDYRYSDSYQISSNTPGHYFDVLLNVLDDSQVTVDPETQVILGFDTYDYGYPGSGLLVWHITEPDVTILFSGINNDRDHRAVHLEEADGALDIGFPSAAVFADPSGGWSWDMWYAGNDAYFFANPAEENDNPDKLLRFDNLTNPNTRSNGNAESFIRLDEIGPAGDSLHFRFSRPTEIPIINLGNGANVVGSSFSEQDSSATVYYLKEGQIFSRSGNELDSLYHGSELIKVLTNPVCGDTTLISLIQYDTIWLNDNCERIDESQSPYGVIVSHGMVNSTEEMIPVPMAESLGDIDGDGLDEIATIEEGNLYLRNGNQTLVDGFPVYGNFFGTILIANIMGDETAEIICQEPHQIVVFDAKNGNRIQSIASMGGYAQLRLIPFWNGRYTALVDGPRLLLFPLDFPHLYWSERHGNPSNSGIVLGEHVSGLPQFSGMDGGRTYNYPNPVTDGETTFRFYIGEDVQKVDILIYDAAGFKIANISETDLTPHEYNEIRWNVEGIDAGVYLAEVRPDHGDSKLVKVVVIQ